MAVTILLIIFNLLFFFFFPKEKKKFDNEYLKEKSRYDRKKTYYILFYSNICTIVINIVYLILTLSYDYIDIISIILTILQLFTFSFIALNYKNFNKKLKIIDKRLFNIGDVLFIITFMIISFSERIFVNGMQNYIFEIIIIILLLVSLMMLLWELCSLKGYICYTIKEKDYLTDIKFANKIQISKIVNYFVYIISYILFVLIDFKYIYFAYALIILLLFYVIKNKIKKVGDQSTRLYQSITIANELPGVEYAFYFFKDVYLIRKLLIIMLGILISVITFYGLGDYSFIYISFAIYNLLLYVILNDKYKLMRYTRALNKELIDENKYSIVTNKKVSYIDTIKILDIKLYRLIIVDNLIYESNIIFYDPELIVNEIELRINKNNLQDYIFNERILYQEDIEEEVDEE